MQVLPFFKMMVLTSNGQGAGLHSCKSLNLSSVRLTYEFTR